MPSFLDFRRTVAALIAVAMSAALIAFAFITSDSFKTHFEASARQAMPAPIAPTPSAPITRGPAICGS